jgi:hypothetical protein
MSSSSMGTSGRSLVRALSLSAALAGALLAWPQTSVARHLHEGAFVRYAGDWRGAGHVVSSDGTAETISCRASGDVSDSGASLSQTLVCASASARFDIRFNAVADGGNVTGTWQETTRGVSGNLTGQIANGAFEGSVNAGGFAAAVSYRSNGRAQTVVIRPNGGAGGISSVEVSLRRRG